MFQMPSAWIHGQSGACVKLSSNSFPGGVTSTATVATPEVVTPSLEAHFAAEEEDLFPLLRAALTADDLVVLADRAAEVRRRAPAFPASSPAGSDHAIA